MKAFRAKLQVDDLAILGCSHDCPVSHKLVESLPNSYLDFTADAIDPGKVDCTYSGSDTDKTNKLSSILSDTSSQQELMKIYTHEFLVIYPYYPLSPFTFILSQITGIK